MRKIKTAVIGVGYLGKFHADKYASLPNCELIAVVDAHVDTAKAIAAKLNVQGLIDYKSLLGKVEAVSIAAPTTLHYQIAKDFLTHGSHVLIEKPITVTVEEADELIELAQKHKRLIMFQLMMSVLTTMWLNVYTKKQKVLFILISISIN